MNTGKRRFLGFAAITLFLGAALVTGCKDDSTTPPPGTNIVPITADLFPLVAGHSFQYTGYATANSTSGGGAIPDPGNVYHTIWTLGPTVPSPLGGSAVLIVDSTTLYIPPVGVVTVARNLLVKKDSVGDFYFMQTIGPFKRAFQIAYGTTAADTLIFIPIVRPSQGAGTTGQSWTAYDQTFTGSGGVAVRLQIFGRIEAAESISDSAGTPAQHTVYRARTHRKVTVGGSVVQDDAETARLWLEPGVGPIWIRIVEDPENIGHWRYLTSRNF
jgi:hypothetical protein